MHWSWAEVILGTSDRTVSREDRSATIDVHFRPSASTVPWVSEIASLRLEHCVRQVVLRTIKHATIPESL